MNRHVWELHAAVYELARARGLRKFEVRYADSGDASEINLVLPPANDTLSVNAAVAAPLDDQC